MAELLCSTDVVPYSEVKRIDEKLQAFLPHSDVFNSNSPSHNANVRSRTPPRTRTPSNRRGGEKNAMTTVFAKEKGSLVTFPYLHNY